MNDCYLEWLVCFQFACFNYVLISLLLYEFVYFRTIRFSNCDAAHNSNRTSTVSIVTDSSKHPTGCNHTNSFFPLSKQHLWHSRHRIILFLVLRLNANLSEKRKCFFWSFSSALTWLMTISNWLILLVEFKLWIDAGEAYKHIRFMRWTHYWQNGFSWQLRARAIGFGLEWRLFKRHAWLVIHEGKPHSRQMRNCIPPSENRISKNE